MIVAALIVASTLATPAADTPIAILSRAVELTAADHLGDAEPLYRDAIRRGDPYTRRQAYLRLGNLYLRSGRADKGVQLAAEFRAWLHEVGDGPGEAELDVLVGECYARLGHYATADRHFTDAIREGRGVSVEGQLTALRGRAEIADQLRDTAASRQRWADLAAAARVAAAAAKRENDVASRVKSVRYLAEALRRKGDTAAALAALDSLPDLHDELRDPLGRRDTQRQRANLLAGAGRYAEAVPLFRETLTLHRTHRANRRMTVGEVLAEWADAAAASGDRSESTRLRREAEVEFSEVLTHPKPVDALDGGPLAAFVRLQLLSRSARQFRKALDLSRGPGDQWISDVLLEVRVKADRGELELIAAAYPTARALLSQVHSEVTRAEPPDLRVLPQVLVNLAAAELAGENPERADPLLNSCAELYVHHRLPADTVLAECDYLRGAAAAQRGDFSSAINHYRRGQGVCEVVGTKAEPVRFNLLLSTALVHKEQGDFAAALDHLKLAAASLAEFAESDDLSFGLIAASRADLHLARADVTAAVMLIPDVEAACERHRIRGGFLWGTARHVRALEAFGRKEVAAAETIWTDLAVLQRTEGQVLLGRTLNYLGLVAEAQGRQADAVRMYEESRAFLAARPWSPAVTQSITLWRLAVQYDRLGRRAEAKQLLAEVFDVADRARLGTLGEAGQRAEFFAQFRPAFELLARWQAEDGDGTGLARTISRSRSRTLLDQVLAAGVDPRESLRGPLRDRLLAREQAARAKVSLLRGKMHFLPTGTADPAAAKALIEELNTAQREFAEVWRDIANEDPVARTLADRGRAATHAVLPPGIGATTAVLTYMIGRDESYAVLFPSPQESPHVYRLAVPTATPAVIGDLPPVESVAVEGRRGLTLGAAPKQPDHPVMPLSQAMTPLTYVACGRLTDHYLRQVSDPAFVPTRGMYVTPRSANSPPVAVPTTVLGNAILPAALRERLRGAQQLVVVPDGPLHKIPLECLVVSSGSNLRYALDELPPVCYAPSLSILAVVFARPSHERPATLLTVGDPAYPPPTANIETALPRLPYTAIESKRLQAFFLPNRVTALAGVGATEHAVTTAISGRSVVHLAAHGFADTKSGNLFAAVALAPPAGTSTPDDDGFLSLHEIYRLPMAGCELTILSACVTNVGPQRPLEAGVTLAGAFLAAGSRRVVATCWSVADRATAELVATFIEAIGPANATPTGYAAALKAARLKVRGTPGWEAPFYWAPFVLTGVPDGR